MYKPEAEEVSVETIVSKIENFFSDHPAVQSKKLMLPKKYPDKRIKTDPPMLLRVLTNMVMNAFEATETGGEVKLDVVYDNDTITFSVWNKECIPEDVQKRIFQQYFSTKNGNGRGFGTYSIKLIGEQFLRGKVSFSSRESKGTVFRFELPQK
jgi:signal transduction histidine kinase